MIAAWKMCNLFSARSNNPNTAHCLNYCEIEFTVRPNELIIDGNNGLFDKSKITWDLKRLKRMLAVSYNNAPWQIVSAATSQSPWTNDDSSNNDEDNNPWNGNGHLYSCDAPGLLDNPNLHLSCSKYVWKFNFIEWVEVSIGSGSGSGGLKKCSSNFYWKSQLSIEYGASGWERSSNYGNLIYLNHDFWGSMPFSIINLTPGPLPIADVGNAYNHQLSYTNGVAPVSFSVGLGILPPGLSINSNGQISGTPLLENCYQPGNYIFEVEINDSSPVSYYDLQLYYIELRN